MTHEERMLVLKEIQASVPQIWMQQLQITVKISPTQEFVAKKALKSPNISPEKKRQIKNLLDTGELSKTKTILNERIAKKIDRFVEHKIKQAIKLGKLPDPSTLQDDEFIKKMNLKYYAPDQKEIHRGTDKPTPNGQVQE